MIGAISRAMNDYEIARQCARSLEALISKIDKYGTDGESYSSEYVKGYLEGVVEYLRITQLYNKQTEHDSHRH